MNWEGVAWWLEFIGPRYLLFIGAAMASSLQEQIKAHIHRSVNSLQVVLLHLELENYTKALEHAEEAENEIKAVGVLITYILKHNGEHQ